MNIKYAVMNKDKVKDLVHVDISGTDLAKVVVAFDEKGNGHLITNRQLAEKRLSDDEVIEKADMMTEKDMFSCKTMTSVLGMDVLSITGDSKLANEINNCHDATSDIWVLSNDKGFLGAAVLAQKDVLKDLHDMIGDYYVLPCSIHEVLAVPAVTTDSKTIDQLEDMVRSVNATQVDVKDQLSDNVYYFDGKSLSMARSHTKDLVSIKESKYDVRAMA